MRIGLIVVGLCTLTIMELGTSARTKTSAPDPFEQLAVDVGVSRDTLEKADRLETHHLQHEAPVQPTGMCGSIARSLTNHPNISADP
jgi:hypothetical protein